MSDTKRLKSYVETTRELERDLRRALVQQLEEDKVIAEATKPNTDGLAAKYGMREN